jgi:hypothetical protein
MYDHDKTKVEAFQALCSILESAITAEAEIVELEYSENPLSG